MKGLTAIESVLPEPTIDHRIVVAGKKCFPGALAGGFERWIQRLRCKEEERSMRLNRWRNARKTTMPKTKKRRTVAVDYVVAVRLELEAKGL